VGIGRYVLVHSSSGYGYGYSCCGYVFEQRAKSFGLFLSRGILPVGKRVIRLIIGLKKGILGRLIGIIAAIERTG